MAVDTCIHFFSGWFKNDQKKRIKLWIKKFTFLILDKLLLHIARLNFTAIIYYHHWYSQWSSGSCKLWDICFFPTPVGLFNALRFFFLLRLQTVEFIPTTDTRQQQFVWIIFIELKIFCWCRTLNFCCFFFFSFSSSIIFSLHISNAKRHSNETKMRKPNKMKTLLEIFKLRNKSWKHMIQCIIFVIGSIQPRMSLLFPIPFESMLQASSRAYPKWSSFL